MRTPTLLAATFILSLLSFNIARASHIVGGEMKYFYLGDSLSGTTVYAKYGVSLSIYEDCLNGSPDAIAQDNPAFLSAFDGAGILYDLDTSVFFSSSITVPIVYSTPCGSAPSSFASCLLKKTFVKTYAFRANATGYTVAYQRCCRNASIANVMDPGNNGSTYFCTIPAYPIDNNSAIFKNYPPQVICLNQPLYYDNSATDADGDSLSYGFCAALIGANANDIKPLPVAPPYDSVTYITPPYSSQIPFTGSTSITINPVTGLITGTPNLIGRYLVTVYCNEWRSGVLINTVRREFQFVVTDCVTADFHPVSSNDTIILVGDSVNFYASGGASYLWVPGTYLTDSTISDPVGHFPVAGSFTYILHAVSDSGCNGTDTVHIQVLNFSEFLMPTAFTPNGDSKNDIFRPIPVFGSTLVSLKVFDRKGIRVYNGGASDPGWDGTYKGVKQDMGTYYWELVFYDNTHTMRYERGDVTLVR